MSESMKLGNRLIALERWQAFESHKLSQAATLMLYFEHGHLIVGLIRLHLLRHSQVCWYYEH